MNEFTTGLNPSRAAGSVAERRQGSRRRVLKSALIVFSNGQCSMPCHILETSEGGAQIAPADILLCPGEFVLRPPVGLPRNCEVVWRKSAKMGVRFI